MTVFFIAWLALTPIAPVIAVVMIRHDVRPPEHSVTSGPAVRRFFQVVLLYGLLITSAIGASGLLERLLQSNTLVGGGDALLVRSVTFIVIGIPLLALVAMWVRRDAATTSGGYDTLGWVLYVTLASLTALVATVAAGYEVLLWAFRIEPFNAGSLSGLIIWGGVWAAHWWLAARTLAPQANRTHLLFGSFATLVGAVVGLAATLSGILEVATGLGHFTPLIGSTNAILPGLALLVVTAPFWILYWIRRASTIRRDAGWLTYVLLIGMGGGLATTVVATSIACYNALVWLVGDPGTSSARTFFQHFPQAVAIALVGGLTWWYHHAVLRQDPGATRTEVERTRDYLLAGIALLAASVGLMLVVVAVVEAASGTALVAGDHAINTLLAAVTLLAVGGATWGWFWSRGQRAARHEPGAEYASTARRFYLFVLLGLASLAAVAALLVGTYILVDAIVGGSLGTPTLREMRFPIGILVAAGAVAAYHWSVWAIQRRDRGTQPTGRGFILLVGPEQPGLVDEVARHTHARVQAWTRTDDVGSWATADVIAALGDEHGGDRIVVAGAGGPIVVPVRRRGGNA